MQDSEPDEFDDLEPYVILSARSRWPHEVRDLTPWVLAHLEELGNELGMTLEPTGTEVAVGTFTADIAAKDGSGRSVLIENQLGPSDHIHFGQVVLYAVESKADAIVWLVTADPRWSVPIGLGLRPEHQRALERLNEVFAGKIEFYGVEVSLGIVPLRLVEPDPPPAPVITVTVKPSSSLPCNHHCRRFRCSDAARPALRVGLPQSKRGCSPLVVTVRGSVSFPRARLSRSGPPSQGQSRVFAGGSASRNRLAAHSSFPFPSRACG